MSGNKPNQTNNGHDLLGYHLGLIDGDERRAIEAKFSRDEISSRCASIGSWLMPLECDECQPCDDLASKIEARIEQLKRPYAVASGAVDEIHDTSVGGPFLSARDLLALAAVITLFVGVFLPSYQNARSIAERDMCARNLGGLGVANVMYSNANNEYLPYAGPAPAGSVWSRDGNGATSSRHGWMLVRGRFASPRQFIDPGRAGDSAFVGQDAERFDDFPDPHNNSYAANPMFLPMTRYQFALRSPIAAGMSPLVDDQRRLRREGNLPKNSPNHRGNKGQNILHADQSVEFSPSTAGLGENDDIFRINGVPDGAYTGYERPRSKSDAFLTP